MTWPPPPRLAFLAYITGKISKAEFEYLTKLWNEKNKIKQLVEVTGNE